MWFDYSRQFQQLNAKLDSIAAQLTAFIKQENKVMSELSDAVAALTSKAASIESTEDSALTVLNGLRDQLKAALANAADATAAVAAVNEVVAALDTHNAPLAAAIATPPA